MISLMQPSNAAKIEPLACVLRNWGDISNIFQIRQIIRRDGGGVYFIQRYKKCYEVVLVYDLSFSYGVRWMNLNIHRRGSIVSGSLE